MSSDRLSWKLICSLTVALSAVVIAYLTVGFGDERPETAESADFGTDAFPLEAEVPGQPLEPEVTEPPSTPPAPPIEHRSGLLHSADEVAIWRRRATTGPYRLAGDVSPNSPGDWARIGENSEHFQSDPGGGRWNGPPEGDLLTCVQQSDGAPPTSGPSNLRDAAFVSLVLGVEAEEAAVKRELLWQATSPGTDFSNSSRWCTGVLVDVNPSFEIAHWLSKLLLAYDYLGPAAFSSSERATLDRWFGDAARFLQADLDGPLESRFVDRGSSDQLSSATTSDPGCDRVHYLDGVPNCSIHRYYNNRRATIARYVALAGIHLDDDELKRSSWLFTVEFLKYGVFPEGFIADFHRWSPDLPDLGWAYGAQTVGPVLVIADVFARAGDTSLYEYTTSVGAFGSEGGPKNLLFTARTLGQHVDGTYERYGTDNSSHRDNPDYRIDGEHAPSDWYGLHDVSFAISNVYYKDDYLYGTYTRSGPGMDGYPSRPARVGAHLAWTGEGGLLPGALFMYGQMEGKVWPY